MICLNIDFLCEVTWVKELEEAGTRILEEKGVLQDEVFIGKSIKTIQVKKKKCELVACWASWKIQRWCGAIR